MFLWYKYFSIMSWQVSISGGSMGPCVVYGHLYVHLHTCTCVHALIVI